MTGGELAIVIAGRREDWPRGPRILAARPPSREPKRADLLVRGRARSGRRPGLVPDRRGRHRPDAREDARGPRRPPHRRPHLDHAGPAARARHQPLRGPGLRARRHVDRTSAVVKMVSLAPTRHAASALERPTPTARRLAAVRRWPQRASGPASPMSRARPGNAPPGSWPATGGPPAAAAEGRRGGSGRRTWPPSSPPATSRGAAAAASSPTPSPASAAASTP